MTETTSSEEKRSESASGEIKTEAVKLFNLLGRAVSITFQEVTNRLPMHLDPEIRHHLDLLVEYGAAQDRQEALKFLVDEGIQANRSLFEKIERTSAQIVALRTQFRKPNPEQETP
jgi:hypothetical protein